MTIHPAKASAYNTVTSDCIYDYIREYSTRIYNAVEPLEDRSGNNYIRKKAEFARKNRTELKAIAAELETVCKRLDYMLEGKY